MSIREIIAAICIFIGLFVFLCSILGIYRFKYAMNRMHAAALGDTMGIFFVVLGLLILGQDIFHMEQCCEQKPFPEYVRWIFVFLAIQSHFDTPDCEGRASDKQRL